MQPHPLEETYKKYLSTDYDLLFNLVKDQTAIKHPNRVICFIDGYHKELAYRKNIEALTPTNFIGLLLGDDFNEPENYIDFCKQYNLTFIKP